MVEKFVDLGARMNLNEVWKSVKGDLQVEMPTGHFNTFIVQSYLTSLDEAEGGLTATITAPTSWHQSQVEQRFLLQIKNSFKRVTGKPTKLVVAHRPDGQAKSLPDNSLLGPLFSHAEDDKKSYHQAIQTAQLRPDFTFEQFAVSSTNEMAYAAAQAVSKNPGQMYQLLFMFGGVGVGKTHLMQAIGHRILTQDPTAKAIYCSGEDFTNEIIEAIQYKSTLEFRKKYRQVKALLIDDIQFIGGKDKVQEEFFHTFNAVQRGGGQIVLTSDQLPREIAGLENRLRSRFEGGLTIDIQEPTFELRTAILLIKARNFSLKLPMDVAQLVAANIESTRGLEGFLTRLMVESQARREPITTAMGERLLGSVNAEATQIAESDKAAVAPAKIIQVVADVFSVKASVLKGKRRKKEIVAPRHLAMYLLRMELGTPYEEIGSMLGGRDHTTVMHAVEKVKHCLPNDERLRGSMTEVRKRIGR